MTGEARYADDLVVPDAAHVAFLWSRHGHARIRDVDDLAPPLTAETIWRAVRDAGGGRVLAGDRPDRRRPATPP